MKFLVTLLIVLVTFATADAAKVDIYKNAIANKTFTLKYKVNEFPIHNISKEVTFKTNFWGKDKITTKSNTQQEKDSGGIIVFNKEDTYLEQSFDIPVMNAGFLVTGKTNFKPGGGATLFKNGETFSFSFELNEDGTKKYFSQNMWGGRTSKVKAQSKKAVEKNDERIAKYLNPYQKLFIDYNFGNTDLYQALAPILPPSQVIATPNTPTYNFVGSGNLDGGLTYEDFYGEKNNFHSAIRYYFSGDKMVKIATFNYLKDENKISFYEKHVIDIEEFLTTADENYLQLPENLQDTTKREDGGDQ